MIETETSILTEDWEMTLYPDSVCIWSPSIIETVYLPWEKVVMAVKELGSVLDQDETPPRPLVIGTYPIDGRQWEVRLPLQSDEDLIVECDGELRSIPVLDLIRMVGTIDEDDEDEQEDP